jgi:hypothetical protein
MKNVKLLWALFSLVTLIAVGQITCANNASAEGYPAYVCPECSSEDTVPIVYGYPSNEMCEAAERGEISLGG